MASQPPREARPPIGSRSPTVPSDPATIRVDLSAAPASGDRSYDIVIGSGVLHVLGRAVASAGGRRAFVVADEAVVATHAEDVSAGLRDAGVDVWIQEIPRGEASKSIDQLQRLWSAMAHRALDRHTHVVGVGGGVVGDLTGFAAATFNRGLAVWHAPTTLVAQVDSAIGGKTGINLDAGKNLVGSFWQPRGVFCDIDSLATLPQREFTSGLAEVVKYGMILDAAFFGWLEGNATDILARDPSALQRVVCRSASLKARVVEQDERETTGLRAILNYGHTFAHAYEAAAGYGTLLHGEAVSIGMVDAAELAVALGRITPDIAARQRALLAAFGLPVTVPAAARQPADALLAIMARDKKTVAGQLRFILPTRIGHVELVDDVSTGDVRRILDR